MEALIEILGSVCCEFMATGGADLLAGFLGWKSHQVTKNARRKGVEPETQFWSNLFKAALPLAIVLTLLFVIMLAVKMAR